MPIVQRPPDPTRSVAASPDIGGVAAQGPPGVLLRPGGPWAPSVRPDPEIVLADAAALVVRVVDRRGRRPLRCTAPPFACEVELVRSHLRPIRSPATLAASYAREVLHAVPQHACERVIGASALVVAHAIRWLEVRDGRCVPGWAAWLGGWPRP